MYVDNLSMRFAVSDTRDWNLFLYKNQFVEAESRWRCGKTQSQHLPTTRAPAGCWWGALTPRRQEASERVGRRGTEGGGEVEARQDRRPWGWGDQERQVGGASRRSGRGEEEGVCPAPLGACWATRLVPWPPRPPPTPSRIGPGGTGGRLGDQERQAGGPPRPEEQERIGARLPRPLEPRKPTGLPGEVPRPLRPSVPWA